jgi:DNA-binding transcriptional MerR regulator
MNKQLISKKPRYNLNLVVQETGLKADTLRAWERRYQMPQPQRTDGGHRLYSDYDIQSIKWLQTRQKEGMRISQAVDYWQDLLAAGTDPLEDIAPRSQADLEPLGSELGGQTLEQLQNKWIGYVLKFDEQGAEQVLTQAFAQFPIEIVCTDLIQAALTQIGTYWYEGKATIQQEHFASELTTRKLQTLISSAPIPFYDKKVLLACPPGEHHTISLLTINLMLRYRGWEVLYLGANVPTARLQETVLETHPDLAVLSASRLPTVAALIDTVVLLREYQIPGAFGGWIFSQISGLVDRIPAHYLGTDLHQSLRSIEKLLNNPSFNTNPAPEALTSEITHYQDNLNLLEHLMLEQINGNLGEAIHADDLQEANDHLSDDIIAALKLGDINILETELAWVEGLLSHRDLPQGLYEKYVNAYTAAAQQVLGDSGQSILSWLKSVQTNLS